MRTLISTAAIALGLGLASPALAQKLPDDADTQIISEYLMPIAFQNIVAGCTGQLSADSYIIANAEELQADFDAAAFGTFDAAQLPLIYFLAGDQVAGVPRSELIMVEEAQIRPFAMQVVGAQVTAALNPVACSRVNRVIEDLAPLPPKQTAGLLGYLVREFYLRPQTEAAREAAAEGAAE